MGSVLLKTAAFCSGNNLSIQTGGRRPNACRSPYRTADTAYPIFREYDTPHGYRHRTVGVTRNRSL